MRCAVALVGVALILAGCGGGGRGDPELRQAELTARYMTSARHLKLSTYSATRATGTPSELISFLFSDLGAPEWPPTSESSEMEREQARQIRAPIQPASVAIVPINPNPRLKKQIVLKPDDAAGTIIAEGYLSPEQPPVFTETWPMPELRAQR